MFFPVYGSGFSHLLVWRNKIVFVYCSCILPSYYTLSLVESINGFISEFLKIFYIYKIMSSMNLVQFSCSVVSDSL